MSKTTNFGLNSFGPEGRISDEGYKFALRDRDTIDKLLYALFNHDHRSVVTSETLTGPKRPSATVSTTGGTLPAGTNYFYSVAWLDGTLSETQVSVSASVRTPDPLPSPEAPSFVVATTGGTLEPGTYKYALAFYQGASGTTRAPSVGAAVVPVGTSTNEVTISLQLLLKVLTGGESTGKVPATLSTGV